MNEDLKNEKRIIKLLLIVIFGLFVLFDFMYSCSHPAYPVQIEQRPEVYDRIYAETSYISVSDPSMSS